MKKIFILSLMLICLNVTLCRAQDIEVHSDMDSGTINVSGSLGIDNANRRVMLYAVKANDDISGLTLDDTQRSTDAVAAIEYCETDDDGNYSFPDVYVRGADDVYIFYVTVDNSDREYASQPVFVASKGTIDSLNRSFQNKDTESIYETMKTSFKVGGMNIDAPVFDLIDDDETLRMIAGKLANREYESTSDIIEAINKASFEVGMENTIPGEALDLLLYPDKNDSMQTHAEDAKAVNHMDEWSSLSTFEVLDGLSQSDRIAVFDQVSSVGYSGTDDLLDKINTAVIMYQIKNCSGYGDIFSILQEHQDLIEGFSFSDYSKSQYMNDLNKSLLTKSFATTKDLSDYISSYLEDGKQSTSGSGGGGGGGGVNSYGGSSSSTSSSRPVLQVQTTPNTPSIQQQASDTSDGSVFTDIAGYDWASEAIEYLAGIGVINGKGDGRFAPQDNVTREEFVKMLVSALGLQDNGNDNEMDFSDVDGESWYAQYIKTAYDCGIINGISDTEFGIGSYISRQDMAVLIARAENISTDNDTDVTGFTDADQISYYAKGSVKYLKDNGIITGYDDGSFKPMANITRAEAAKVLYELVK